MSEVIGPFKAVVSTQDRVGAHVSHLRHLLSTTAACRLLVERFRFPGRSARETAQMLSAHVAQALSFHEHSLKSTPDVRPMLQYYSYLNLAVAVVLAHRPPNYEQYRQHGVEDRSHALRDLDLKSVLVKAKRGAVPLFHSLLSQEGIVNRPFRLNELLGAIPLVRYELTELFSLPSEAIAVDEAVQPTSKGT